MRALHVGVEGAAHLDAALRGEDGLGRLGGKLAARFAGAGLDDHGPALHRARDIERPAHVEIFALVVEHVEPVGIEIDAALDVADERVLGPAVPQPGHDLDEFARARIALAMLQVILEAEIARGIGVGRGDDVPRRRARRSEWSSEAKRRAT